jgi:endonuclease I
VAQKPVLDTAIAIWWPSEPIRAKIVAREDGCLDNGTELAAIASDFGTGLGFGDSMVANRMMVCGIARTIALVAVLAGLPVLAAADIYEPPANYYSTATATDATLLMQLRTIVSNMTGVNYGNARYSAPYTDPDPNAAGKILLIYNRASVSEEWSTSPLIWNREHIWPDSRLGPGNNDPSASYTGIASDQINLRPADPIINGNRGNKPFGLDNTTGSHSSQGTYYYPGDADAGDVARAQFYMATRWSTLSLTDATIPETGGLQMGDLSSLINYHFKDVPDTFERRRNHAIYGLAGENSPAITNPYKQSNRNPYVDHPEFAWPIFKPGINNTSQISIAGGTMGGDGGWTRNVDLGRVFVGAAVPGAQDFTLNRAGLDGTYFEVTTSGAATSSLSGRFNAFKNNEVETKSITVGLNTTTSSAGLKSGMVTINNLDITNTVASGQGSGDANDLFNVSLTVLDHAAPSFVGVSEVTTLMHDFGSIVAGSPAPTFNFDVFNYGVLPAFTADLDFDSFLSSGDASVLTTNLAGSAGSLSLDGGASQGFTAMLDSATPGNFSASYTLSFSDEDLSGALSKLLTLTLTGEVLMADLPGDYNDDDVVDAADYTVWRDNLGSLTSLPSDDTPGVDVDDYDRWKLHFGETAGSGLGAAGSAHAPASVPEPATCALLLIAVAACRGRRRSAIQQARIDS